VAAKILVIDHDPKTRKATNFSLSFLGYTVPAVSRAHAMATFHPDAPRFVHDRCFFKALLCCLALVLACSTKDAQARIVLNTPPGILGLCYHTPSLCQHQAVASVPATMIGLIASANTRVNHGIIGTDLSNSAYPTRPEAQNWELVAPGGAGDCKDYALTKLFVLSWAGVPLGAMRMAVVHVPNTPSNTSHAILTVQVEDQEMVLDNLTDAISPLSQSPDKMQTIQDPRTQSWTEVR